MKNRSFCRNKTAGAKGKTLACMAAAVALLAALLFMMCANNDSGTTPTPPPGPSGQCDGLTVAQPGSACCTEQPAFNGCSTNPDPCTANPNAQGCPGFCVANPNAEGCDPNDPCIINPTPNCSNYCIVYPNNEGCPGYNPCTANPSAQGCPGFCAANPTAPECVDPDNPCALGPSIACCNAQPTYEGCGGEPNPCANGPSVACCDANPNYSGCNPVTGPCDNGPSVACCAAIPNFTGCSTEDKKYCRWDNDPANCYEIGGQYSDTATATEASCKANYGEVVSNCNEASQLEYCRWDGVCSAITDPTGPSENAGMTNRENCAAYGEGGVHSSLTACEAYVPTGPEYYCYWTDPTEGCFKISNPGAESSDNPGMTNQEVCEQFSLPGKVFTTSNCDGYTPPAVTYYCDWGPYNPNAANPDDKKGCWPTTQGNADCEAWGTFVECHKGNAPADGPGSCCAQ